MENTELSILKRKLDDKLAEYAEKNNLKLRL